MAQFRNHMNPPVFWCSSGLVAGFVAYGALHSEQARRVFEAAQQGLTRYFGWFYILSASAVLAFMLWLAFSKAGNIRLGGDEVEPEFHLVTWFTMLLSAGMGIGLVFFGVAEPLAHYATPLGTAPRSEQAIQEALLTSFFHWGLHPWAIYLAIALPLAYYHFRYQLPLAPRSLLYPLIGDRIHGWLGHGVDVIAVLGTLFGLGTSLGLGAMQINAGLHWVADIPMRRDLQLLTIAVITGIATVSVVTGLKVGIRRLSQFNMLLAAALLCFVLVAGPSVYIIETFTRSLGHYLQNLVARSFWVDHAQHGDWQGDWTLFYWSWWIAWSPFVGMFAARISRGRSLRAMIVAMLLIPTVMGALWFSALGGTALFIEHYGSGGIAEAVRIDEAIALYALLGKLPLSVVTSLMGGLMIVLFFVTSSDSGSLVVVMLTSGGKPDPHVAYRILWCVTEGVVAATLLVAGGLQALRSASLLPALPMAIFLWVACYGLFKAVRVDVQTRGRPARGALPES